MLKWANQNILENSRRNPTLYIRLHLRHLSFRSTLTATATAKPNKIQIFRNRNSFKSQQWQLKTHNTATTAPRATFQSSWGTCSGRIRSSAATGTTLAAFTSRCWPRPRISGASLTASSRVWRARKILLPKSPHHCHHYCHHHHHLPLLLNHQGKIQE